MNLSPIQEAAVTSHANRLAVAAGPGSGKTRVLVDRIANANQLTCGLQKIVAITYTNEAAAEIQRRLDAIGCPVHYCGTLHGFCLRLLRANAAALGMPERFAVMGEDEANKLIEEVMRDFGCRGPLKNIKPFTAINPRLKPVKHPTEEETVAIAYHQRMLEAGMLDYDAILSYTLALIKERKLVYDAFHLFVDEYQDVAEVDHEIYMFLPTLSWTVVGDPDQSIFGFRGGSPKWFNSLAVGGDGFKTVWLETNYRSGPEICQAATSLIQNNERPVKKVTVADAGNLPSLIRAWSFKNGIAEMGSVGRFFLRVPNPNDWAILCRSNREVEKWVEVLRANQVPVRRRQVKNFPADWRFAKLFVALLCNPDNDRLAYWFLQARSRKEADEAKLYALSMFGTINQNKLKFPAGLSGSDAVDFMAQNGVSVESVARLKEHLKAIPSDGTILDLASEIAKPGEPGTETGEGVTVITMHGAKGREWDNVWIPGFCAANMPSKRGDLEEERRLAFVAMTRARRCLAVTFPFKVRPFYGPDEETEPCRFLAEAGIGFDAGGETLDLQLSPGSANS